MVTIEECRKRLGKKAEGLSDKEITQLRDALHQLAETVIDDYFKKLDQERL